MATHALVATGPDLSDAALDLLTRRLAERAEDYDRNPRFPRENFDILAEHGLIGLTVEPRGQSTERVAAGVANRILGDH